MKKRLFNLFFAIVVIGLQNLAIAQTPGTLTFTFSEIPKTPTYDGTSRHVLAVWVQTSTGAFVKTKLRYAGGSTSDHLPTWAANAGCASSLNCLGAACNVVDATTGATRTSWTTYTVSWDGKKGATSTGTLQPDGIYKVTIQSTWSHAGSGTATTSYTFTKGPNADHQTPAATTTFSNVTLDWTPSVATGINEQVAMPEISIYPNPTAGEFNVDYFNASEIKVLNTLGVVVYEEKINETEEGTKKVDLSKFANGIYVVNVSNENGSSNHKIVLNR